MATVRVLLVDPSPTFHRIVLGELNAARALCVRGCSSGHAALELLPAWWPQILVVSADLRDLPPSVVIEEAQRRGHLTTVLMGAEHEAPLFSPQAPRWIAKDRLSAGYLRELARDYDRGD